MRHSRAHGRSWAARLTRNLLLWLLPVLLVWTLVTPFYNRLLVASAGNLLALAESPDVTRLLPAGRHDVTLSRADFPPARANLYRIRVTDLHFHLLLLGALFLAVPGVPLKRRLANLGWASLISVFFHLLLLVLWVQFVYATQLGEWSLEHYGPVARNAWGMAKHLADLPIKLALPLALWAAFYLRQVGPGPADSGIARSAK